MTRPQTETQRRVRAIVKAMVAHGTVRDPEQLLVAFSRHSEQWRDHELDDLEDFTKAEQELRSLFEALGLVAA